MDTRIGVVIRTLNESELLGRCLETLQAQQGGFDLDVVVVDSGSTDGTVDIARAHGARVIEIAPADFDYSTALNVGIEEARAELVVLLSAHAIPLDDLWLSRMTAPFTDEQVAGVTGGQVPWPGAPWWEIVRLSRAFGDSRRAWSATDSDGLMFSNAASCIRRGDWRDEPFTLPAAEDLDWAQRMVAAGRVIVYEPAATVYHSHDESPRAQARRMIDINRVALNGTPPTRRRGLREGAGLLLRNGRSILALDEPLTRRCAHFADMLRMVRYYVQDYTLGGSTAERRQQDAPGPPVAGRVSSF
jgi:glycosyltransferase involved in cell wall biosynthesis